MSTNSSKLFLSIDDLPEVFHDLEPVPEDDTVGAVARIDYSQDFVTAYNYQRAVWKVNETNTPRALQLSALCLRLNPANYTVWHFRRLCLEQIYTCSSDDNSDWSYLNNEMYLTSLLGGDNPKNYQIWYHRRALLERLSKSLTSSLLPIFQQQYQDELDYIATVLKDDGKNYHAWSHRQWVISTMSKTDVGNEVWEKELEYTVTLIQADHRNNSAWNQRWFVIHKGEHATAIDGQLASQECEYALSIAQLDPYNESPWRYLVAILKENILQLEAGNDKNDTASSLLVNCCDKVRSMNDTFFRNNNENNNCSPNLTSALIDILELKGDKSSIQEAIDLSKVLANEHDTIRCKYWNHRVSKLELKL